MPSPEQQADLLGCFPDALLFCYPKTGHALERDFKWLGSYRHGIVHLGGRDAADLRERTERVSRLLGWVAPYVSDTLAVPRAEPLPCTVPPNSQVSNLDLSLNPHRTPEF